MGDNLGELWGQASTAIGDLDAQPVVRFVEIVCSMISWSVLASAHRGGFHGLYEYDRYTPLNFLLMCAILQWAFAIGIVVAKQMRIIEAGLAHKCELYGTAITLAMIYTGAVAGAASSTQLHDEFYDDSSTCKPRDVSSRIKNKADYFCSRVAAAVAFAFFATAANAGSLALVVIKNKQANSEHPATDAYSPIGGPDVPVAPGAYHVNGPTMEGVGSDDVSHTKDAAVDL